MLKNVLVTAVFNKWLLPYLSTKIKLNINGFYKA